MQLPSTRNRIGAQLLELNDYLGLTRSEARAQWLSIAQRTDPGERRQVDFLPIETLICFGLGLVAPPSASGNINIRESSDEVKRLATLFKRRPTSLAAKLANLDGRRPNGAKHERALWAVLSNDLVRFEHLYEITMDAGRRVGLVEQELPDFLGVETHTLQAVLDADHVSYEELREAIEGGMRDWVDNNPGADSAETERVLLGTARVGQQQFARSVLSNCGFACVFCGLSFRASGLPSSRMLVASHIKPWRDSSGKERLDLRNGVAACPTHDAAFDSFLITFSPDLEVQRSPSLQAAIAQDLVVSRQFGDSTIATNISDLRFRKRPAPEYVAWHNARFIDAERSRFPLASS